MSKMGRALCAGVCLIQGLAVAKAPGCPASDSLVVASVSLAGLRITRPGVVLQELRQRVGRKFSCRDWEKERNRLKDLDVFASVSLQARSFGDSVALRYRFVELPPYVPLLTVDKTDQDGWSIGPHVLALNFLGTAKQVDLLARFLGTTEYQASVSGRQLFGRPIEFDAAWIHVDSYNPYDSFHEYSHRIKCEGYWPWTEHFGAVWLGEWYWIRGADGITLRSGGDEVPRLGAGLRFDTRDRAYLPRRGFFAETRLTENGGALGGPADYWEELIDVRAYAPLSTRQGLVVDGLYQFRRGPADGEGRYDDFHAGGANSLRGFSENSFQGRSECLLNAEYRFDLVTERVQSLKWWSLNYAVQAVAGLDAASLWNGNSPAPGDFARSGYVGLHVLLPGIERLRFEVGSDLLRFNVQGQIGLFEKTTVQRYTTR